MDDDTKAIVVGLSAGIGGFVGLLVLFCICWQMFCGSWCEKKNVPSTVRSIRAKNQRRTATAINGHTNVSTITPMRIATVYSGLKTSSSNDLASKVKAARQ